MNGAVPEPARSSSRANEPPRNATLFDALINAIIRPPRMNYTREDLGHRAFRLRDVIITREDFQLVNNRGMKLMCSLWSPKLPPKQRRASCILYLHSNASCRIDVIRARVIELAALTNSCVCGFDFSGSGQSDGEYISLGWFESLDTRIVFDELVRRGFSKVLVWGRSMGAATALMFADTYSDAIQDVCSGLVLDSPFSSFEDLALHIAKTSTMLPSFAARPALGLIQWAVMSRANFDIYKLNPVSKAASVRIPTVVLTADSDQIVPPCFSTSVFEALKGPKVHIVFQGTHNSRRPQEIHSAVLVFIEGRLSNSSMPSDPERLMKRVKAAAINPVVPGLSHTKMVEQIDDKNESSSTAKGTSPSSTQAQMAKHVPIRSSSTPNGITHTNKQGTDHKLKQGSKTTNATHVVKLLARKLRAEEKEKSLHSTSPIRDSATNDVFTSPALNTPVELYARAFVVLDNFPKEAKTEPVRGNNEDPTLRNEELQAAQDQHQTPQKTFLLSELVGRNDRDTDRAKKDQGGQLNGHAENRTREVNKTWRSWLLESAL